MERGHGEELEGTLDEKQIMNDKYKSASKWATSVDTI